MNPAQETKTKTKTTRPNKHRRHRDRVIKGVASAFQRPEAANVSASYASANDRKMIEEGAEIQLVEFDPRYPESLRKIVTRPMDLSQYLPGVGYVKIRYTPTVPMLYVAMETCFIRARQYAQKYHHDSIDMPLLARDVERSVVLNDGQITTDVAGSRLLMALLSWTGLRGRASVHAFVYWVSRAATHYLHAAAVMAFLVYCGLDGEVTAQKLAHWCERASRLAIFKDLADRDFWCKQKCEDMVATITVLSLFKPSVIAGKSLDYTSQEVDGCNYCGKRANKKLCLCSGCREVHYCSKDCQVNHWPMHKDFCTKDHLKDGSGKLALISRVRQMRGLCDQDELD